MKKLDLSLKPETLSMLKRASLLLCALYGLSLLLFCEAGGLLDYHAALAASQGLATGLRGSVALLILGFLFMECK